ncbi:MAG: glycosyltransferase [Ginsengibacter sp.]
MKKLRVGVWLENYEAAAGGGFGYYTQLVKKINTYNFKDADIVFLSNNNEVDHINFERKYNIKWKPYHETRAIRIINFAARKLRISTREKLREKRKKENEGQLKRELNQYVDVIYYLSPTCVFPDFPYIYTIWDLGHLSMYAFPEVNMNNVFEKRKYHHDHYPHKALMIFAESNKGKQEIIQYLKINEERIKVVPLFPSEIVNEDVSPKLPESIDADLFFIHYPAQYWAHKNHFNLLMAFTKIIEKIPSIKLILTGADKGNKEYIKQLIAEYNLDRYVIDMGFVSNEELKWLYLNSQGLVMPTFLGPTNMPILEAAELGCPVACSKLEGHIEQLGDYGYYFDPKDPKEIASTICAMIDDKTSNIKRNYKNNFNINRAMVSIDKAFSELKHIRFCWGFNDEIF